VLSEFWSLSNYAKATPQNSKINELKKPITQEVIGISHTFLECYAISRVMEWMKI